MTWCLDWTGDRARPELRADRSLPDRDARVGRRAAARRDGANRGVDLRLARRPADRRRDRRRGRRRDRGRQPRLLGRANRRQEAARALGTAEALERGGASLVGTLLPAPRLEDGLHRPLLRRAARDRGLDGRDLPDAMVEVPRVERDRRDRRGGPRRRGGDRPRRAPLLEEAADGGGDGALRRAVAALLAAFALLPGAQAAERPVPAFERAVVIVFENKAPAAVLGNSDAPTFNSLASRNTVLSSYGSITHPSLPNYLALVSGSTHGISSDCTSCLVSGPSLADTLQRAHRTWKTYAEGLPRPGYTGCCSGRYAKKHVPFLYFRRVVSSPARLRRVVPLSRLSRDLAAG